MKESTRLRIYAIVILVVFAFIDAIPYTAVTAFIGIVILLFRPKWFQRIVNRMYD